MRHKSRQPRDEHCSVDLVANIEDGRDDSCLLEDGCEDSLLEDLLRSWPRRRMRTWLQFWHATCLQIRTEEGATHTDTEGTTKCTSDHTTQTNKNKSSHNTHNTDQHRGFKQTEEESYSPVLEARGRGEGGVLCLTCSSRREKQLEVDGVAGALLLPVTISSSVWHS